MVEKTFKSKREIVFEFKTVNRDMYTKEDLNRLRMIMLSFENMVNSTLPQIRVHLSEFCVDE